MADYAVDLAEALLDFLEAHLGSHRVEMELSREGRKQRLSEAEAQEKLAGEITKEQRAALLADYTLGQKDDARVEVVQAIREFVADYLEGKQ